MNILLISFTFIFSFVLTYYVRRFALKNNIIDTPNERSSHSNPTPRGGGLAIVLSFYFAVMAFFFLGYIETDIFYALLGISSIAIIGFIDDHQHVSARYRLLVHFFAAAWVCYWLGTIPWNLSEHWLVVGFIWCVTLFYLVWLLNLYNFMDGIDGIATIEAMTIILSVIILLLLDNNPLNIDIMMALFAALLGFIIWNWPPAKIFMGDVGSAFLGILMGSFSLITANDGSLDFSIWLILMAVFITDASYTLFIRLIRGEKIYEAHRSHSYQIMSRLYGHKRVTMAVLIVNCCWLLPLAYIGHNYEQFFVWLLIAAYLPLVLIAIKYRAGCHV